jgi:hypothetical protein
MTSVSDLSTRVLRRPSTSRGNRRAKRPTSRFSIRTNFATHMRPRFGLRAWPWPTSRSDGAQVSEDDAAVRDGGAEEAGSRGGDAAPSLTPGPSGRSETPAREQVENSDVTRRPRRILMVQKRAGRMMRGDTWVPTNHGPTAHGGPHWDVETSEGGYRNVYPRCK